MNRNRMTVTWEKERSCVWKWMDLKEWEYSSEEWQYSYIPARPTLIERLCSGSKWDCGNVTLQWIGGAWHIELYKQKNSDQIHRYIKVCLWKFLSYPVTLCISLSQIFLLVSRSIHRSMKSERNLYFST